MNSLNDTLSDLRLGQAITFNGLSVNPIFSAKRMGQDYLTIDEALAKGRAKIVEVSLRGVVSKLCVDNQGEENILLVDGDELVGAKQDRSVNISILAGARQKTEIPVSCVEASRWSYKTEHFASLQRSLYSRVRASKAKCVTRSLRTADGRIVNQAEVWDDIASCSQDIDPRSTYGSLSGIYDRLRLLLGNYSRAFKVHDGQVGAVYSINGMVKGAELFDNAHAFRSYCDRLVQSYAIDAILHPHRHTTPGRLQSPGLFMTRIIRAHKECYPALGLGEDVRLSGQNVSGGALMFEGRLVHLAAFRVDEKTRNEPPNRSKSADVLPMELKLAA